jgi:dTDP-4-amino-4,6-dideoxygalactose transaminase
MNVKFLGTISFHETKNVLSGEGGALQINYPDLVERAEIVREKGTNRNQSFKGASQKKSYLPLWIEMAGRYTTYIRNIINKIL